MFIANYQERGMEKEKKFRTGIMQKQQEEERARVPKANPYPHTTNYRVVRRFIIAFYVIYFANVKRHALLITSLFLYAGSTKTKAQTMHTTRTFPTRESGKASRGIKKRK